MRVLVTRPAISAGRTGQRLAALGHEPVLLPLFEPEHDPDGVAMARATGDAEGVIATSAEAIRALGSADRLARLPVFAVGRATARAAADAGFSTIETADGDGSSLARYLDERYAGRTRPHLLYLAGEPRAPHLEQALAVARFRITPATCYRMKPAGITGEQLQSLFQPAPDAVLLYSSEAARRFFEIAGPFVRKNEGTKILCLSPTIADAVPAGFKHRVKSALRPDEDSLFELL
jgi:uroporphyrinogen-III synthase